MEKSETIKNLAEALSKFQSEMEAITKDAQNPFFKSKYASLSAIIEDTRVPLGKNGLSYAQFPSGDASLTTILMHKSGEWISDTYTMHPADNKPQSVGSALTYMRRYALCAVLGLAVEDDDGNEASAKRPARSSQVIRVPMGEDEPVGEIQIAGVDEVEPPKKSALKKPPSIEKGELEKKDKIKRLLDAQSLVDLTDKKDYEEACLHITGLVLTPSNYPKIIERLEALKK